MRPGVRSLALGLLMAAGGLMAVSQATPAALGTPWGETGDAHLSWAFVTANASAAYTVGGVLAPSTGLEPGPTSPRWTGSPPTARWSPS